MSDFDSLWSFDQPAESEKRFRAYRPSSPDEALEVQTQIARALGLQRQFDEAHRVLDAVVTSSPRGEVRYLLERGRVFNSSGQPDKAKALFLGAWEKSQAAKLDFFAVDAAHMLAIIAPLDEALAWNEKAIALAEKSSDPKAQGWIGSLLNNLGWTYYDQREFARALDVFERDLKWFEGRKLTDRADLAREAIAECRQKLAQE